MLPSFTGFSFSLDLVLPGFTEFAIPLVFDGAPFRQLHGVTVQTCADEKISNFAEF